MHMLEPACLTTTSTRALAPHPACRPEQPHQRGQGDQERPPGHGCLCGLCGAGKPPPPPACALGTAQLALLICRTGRRYSRSACRLPKNNRLAQPWRVIYLTTHPPPPLAACLQALLTREGPIEALQSHLSSPFTNNFLGSILNLPNVIGK